MIYIYMICTIMYNYGQLCTYIPTKPEKFAGSAGKPRVFKENQGFSSNSDQYIFWEPSDRGCCFEAFNPRLISRVIKVKSRVHHGFVTGLEKHGVFPKFRVSGSKPRVSVAKSWVVTGKSRVNHGFGVCITSDLVFSCKKLQNYQKRWTNPGNSRF